MKLCVSDPHEYSEKTSHQNSNTCVLNGFYRENIFKIPLNAIGVVAKFLIIKFNLNN